MTFRFRNLMGNVRLAGDQMPEQTHTCCGICTTGDGDHEKSKRDDCERPPKPAKPPKLEAAELAALRSQMHGLIQAEP